MNWTLLNVFMFYYLLMLLTWLLLLCILHVLIHYVTLAQQQNDALCEQSLLYTENYQLHCFVADSKLQFNNYVEESHSHAQVIQLLSCVTYLLFSSHTQPSFHFRSCVYKLMTGCEVCNMQCNLLTSVIKRSSFTFMKMATLTKQNQRFPFDFGQKSRFRSRSQKSLQH